MLAEAQRQDEPARWREQIEEGLWRADLLFGIPFWLNAYHPTCWLIGFLVSSWTWVWGAFMAHAVFAALTEVEPEWMTIAHDFLNEPGEIEP